MSDKDLHRKLQERTWPACVGDFPILKDALAEKDTSFWFMLQLFDSLLRGFGQVVFANNSLSGLLIVGALALTAPGTFIFAMSTAFLGLLLSLLMRSSREHVRNGLTVFNPLLVGAVSYAVIPKVYGDFDSFTILLILLATIFSVYFARSLGSDKFPCLVWPLNLAEFAVLFVLDVQNGKYIPEPTRTAIFNTNNMTSVASMESAGFIAENMTDHVVWGMILRGVVASASQVFAVNNVALGSAIYLGILIYSPVTALFSFFGALFGAIAGLLFAVPQAEIYAGIWGYNSLLTGAALGGNLLVLNGQSVAATFVAIIYTTIVQYGVQSFFKRAHLPIITIPFVISTTLFLKLQSTQDDDTFPYPVSHSFPEKQRYDYLAKRRSFAKNSIDDDGDVEAIREAAIKSRSCEGLH